MPTDHLVLRCAKCLLFQVHQTRKDRKWVCKVCFTKQSVLKVFAEAPARDCRTIVQQLNMNAAVLTAGSENTIPDVWKKSTVQNSSNLCDVSDLNLLQEEQKSPPLYDVSDARSDMVSEYRLKACSDRKVVKDQSCPLDMVSETPLTNSNFQSGYQSKWSAYL
ncbi:unnamed protein product [Dicrocoelium dendriticum]|nr:unnamed protein product [Dicrocoelium dendriticum]